MKNIYNKVIIPSEKNRAEIEQISKNLSECFNLNYFYFYKVKNDGNYGYFANRMDWNNVLINHYANSSTDGILSWYKPCNRVAGFGIKSLNEMSINKISHSYEINYLFEFGYTNQDGFEYFGFGNSSNQISFDSYVNEIPLLKLFTKQLRKKYSFIFKDVENNLTSILPFFEGKFNEIDTLREFTGNKKALLKTLGLNNIQTLSKREEEVATLLIKGLSANEIALFFNLSKRTIETQINSIKQKFNCFSKSELIEMCQTLESINFFKNRSFSLTNEIL